MNNPTIKHTAICNRPLIAIETPYKTGINKDKKYGISYDGTCKHSSLLTAYSIRNNIEFPLEQIIQDYIRYYGLIKAINILIGKGIINSVNRPILII